MGIICKIIGNAALIYPLILIWIWMIEFMNEEKHAIQANIFSP